MKREDKNFKLVKTGVLLVNLGTPDAPDRKSVRRYLREFLSDPRVVEGPRVIWWIVLHLIILTFRPGKSAKAYQKIWTKNGSPLLTISVDQTDALREELKNRHGENICVELAMRYGSPSIESGLNKLKEFGAKKILILPMYPQYSATTTASIFDEVTDQIRKWRYLPEMRFVNFYHDNQDYINALAESVKEWQKEHGIPDKLLLSFHGIPKEYFEKGDPYYCYCRKTGRLLAETLNLKEEQWQLSFQSRLGPRQWLQPYTDKTLEKMGEDGINHIQVICPGFSADCLETLEEVAMENKEIFQEAGGKRYEYIPCLNSRSSHIKMLKNLVTSHIHGWLP
tara:strand:- start:953 stop:1966 length:1014 start_codon:yes stop_codon:yes gene_type:complete